MLLRGILKLLQGSTYAVVGQEVEKKLWLEFQTIDECSMTGNATVTKYPTEMGTQRTDYKYNTPDSVSMVGIIARGGIGGGPEPRFIMNTPWHDNAIRQIRDNLRELKRNMILVTVNTRNGGLWKNMTLTDYTIDETPDNFGLFQVTMQFQDGPQFNEQGELVRNVSDSSTKSMGIAGTQ